MRKRYHFANGQRELLVVEADSYREGYIRALEYQLRDAVLRPVGDDTENATCRVELTSRHAVPDVEWHGVDDGLPHTPKRASVSCLVARSNGEVKLVRYGDGWGADTELCFRGANGRPVRYKITHWARVQAP